MPTSAPYHHGNLREALVEAAVEVARERGPDGLALRDLARRVGVSHNAAYRHFADRDALIEEVAGRGLDGLVAAMAVRLAGCEEAGEADPVARARQRLRATGRGYVDFALAEPGLFRVLFAAYPEVPGSVGPDRPDPFEMLNAALDDLVAVGYLDPQLRPGSEITCWAAVHGFAQLVTAGPLRALPPSERDAALAVMLDTLDRSYGARPQGRALGSPSS